MRSLFSILVLSLNLAHAAIKEQSLEYKDGATTLEGFVASPEGALKVPGIIVVHDWKGPGDFSKQRARQLAELGYIAFEADIYGKGIRPSTPEEAGKNAGIYKGDPVKFRSRMNAALKKLKSLRGVDPEKIAVLGFCFGGTGALELARTGARIKGAISFHGGLATKAPLKKAGVLNAKILVLHGADDPNVPPEEVAQFENEMRTANADWQLVSYGGAVHSFTNPAAGNDPQKGAAYNATADKRSFEAMKTFLAEIF